MKGCCIVGCPYFGIRAGQITFHVFPDPERELYRHRQWRDACSGNPRILNESDQRLYRFYRICRRHFAADCLNGVCRRLLATAVPTLHLHDGDYGHGGEDTTNAHTTLGVGELTTLEAVDVLTDRRIAVSVDTTSEDDTIWPDSEDPQSKSKQERLRNDDRTDDDQNACKRRKLMADDEECANVDEETREEHIHDDEIEWIILEDQAEVYDDDEDCPPNNSLRPSECM